MNKNTIEVHNCKNKRGPHKPEIKEEFKNLNGAIRRGRELCLKYQRNVYINWYNGKTWAYLINANSLIINKYNTKKGIK